MVGANPAFILRNYLAQQAIDSATQGDYNEVSALLTALRHPYNTSKLDPKYCVKRPDWAAQKAGCSMLSCSS